MRLTGFHAIEYAEKHGLRLTRKADRADEYQTGLSVAEAEAIADEDEDLIFLDVPDEEYANAPPTDFAPER
jgi:hypothetical protein